jgi:two-component system LytT family sensor kinase
MDTTARSAPFPRWPLIAAFWSGVGLINASQTVFPMRALGMHHAWTSLFATLTLVWLPWALATPVVIRLGRRCPPARSTALSGWTIHAAAVTAIGLICAAWSAELEILLNPWAQTPPPGPFLDELLPKFYYGQLTSLVLYAFILTIDYVLDSRQRIARQQLEAVRLSEQLSKAQLDALRRQMEPHFIFNALNAISGLVRDNCNDAAVETIAVLSNFLRRATQESNRPLVALQEEMETLRQYLEIQKTRFAERLQINVHIPADLLATQVPSLILQPLVENAIKHGISKRANGGLIQVAAASSNGRLCLSVDNDGPALPADWETRRTGIGIANLRTRLQIMYGTGFELSLRNQGTGGVQALLCLPLATV